MNKLINMKEMLIDAKKNHYAIPHINVNNLEWIQAVLLAAKKARSPIIIGVSSGAKKYMGSYKLIVCMVNNLINDYSIDVPVALHLDHGNYNDAIDAIEAGFSSIMYDGSKLKFTENLINSKKISKLCQQKKLSLEIEVGQVGGYEDGITSYGENADVGQCVEMTNEVEFDVLAASIGNIHGLYPRDWKGLNFELLKEIATKTQKPLVLHGGSGIPELQVKKAISLGICKVNVNTECQIAFTKAINEYYKKFNDFENKKAYDPRYALNYAKDAIMQVCYEKFKLFGSEKRIK